MPAVQVQCPACARTYSIDSQLLGNRGHCRNCGERFSLCASSINTDNGPDTPAPASIPAKIGRFAIRSRLGSGAFGSVYRGHDPDLDREIALKVPHPGTMDDPRSVERFLREAKTTARLRHPNIVPVFEIGVAGANYYIASAFIAGETLAEVVDRGPLEPKLAASIVANLAEALQTAHDLGIVHRDVKPLNVMIDPDGCPMLMDFGLARWDGSAEKLTHDGAILGTPAYMAPEQAQGQSRKATSASDQYALGVMLYELLCGRVPFSGPLALVIFNSVHTDPPKPSSIHAAVPPDLETICLKAMAKKPVDRYPNCKALTGAIRDWIAGRSTISPPISVVVDPEPLRAVPRPRPVRKPPKPRNLAIGAAAVVLLIGGIVWWRREPAASGIPSPGPERDVVSRKKKQDPAIRDEPQSPAIDATTQTLSLRPEELLDPGLQVPYKQKSPKADGVIEHNEYGPALFVNSSDRATPGRTYSGKIDGPDDLSYHLFTAYTDTDLFIALRVRDDIVISDREHNYANDNIAIYIDGDSVPNDFFSNPDGSKTRANREGFTLVSDTRSSNLGSRWSPDLSLGDWSSCAKIGSDGYVMEFQIPLKTIDTMDGPQVRDAAAGSTIRFNVSVMDIDGTRPGGASALWHEKARTSSYSEGESAWRVKLHLDVNRQGTELRP